MSLTLFAGAAAKQTDVTHLSYLALVVSSIFQKNTIWDLFIVFGSSPKIVISINVLESAIMF